MGRRRITDPKSSTSQLIEAVGYHARLPKSRTLLAQRGMRVYKKEELAKRCYLCKSQGSLDNQLIPRWISKETMVSVCAGCHERTTGWVKDEPIKTMNWWETNKEANIVNGALSSLSSWKKGNEENAVA